MTWQFTPFIFPLIISAGVSLYLAIFSWRHKATSGATSFAVLMFCVAFWSMGYAIQLSLTTLQAKLLLSNIVYIAIFVIPPSWFTFCLRYAGKERWLSRTTLALLVAVPVILLAIVWTDGHHHTYRAELGLDQFNDTVVMQTIHGPTFLINVLVSYPLIALGTFFLAQKLLRSPGVYRRQALIILVSVLAPWASNILSITNLIPVRGIDLTPIAFIITGPILAWGIFRFQLLNIVPIARDMVIENMRDGVIVLDARQRIVDMNPSAQAILNLPASGVIGRPAREALGWWPELAEYAQDFVEVHKELKLREDNNQRYYDLRVSPLRHATSGTAGRLIVLRDITARKRSEGELGAILESIADGVIVFDADGKADVANHAITYLLGLSEDEILGRDIEGLMGDRIPAEELAVMATAMNSDIIYCPNVKFEWDEKTLSTSIAPVRLGSGETLGSVAVFRDFTREAEIDRMRNTFLSIASHDLRTPLNSILGYAEMLEADLYDPLTEQQRGATDRILANVKYMLSLANNLLDRAQMESGSLELARTPFSPAALLKEVIEATEILAHSKSIDLLGDFSPDLPSMIYGDRQRLSQVFINLVSNAIKFTDVGAVEVRAYLPDAEHWAVDVADTGPGIPEEAWSYIFEPFRRAKNEAEENQSGAGLGLYIARQLVELMGGQITLESVVRQGTTFTVLLPLPKKG